MGETQTYYVVVQNGEYVKDAGDGTVTKYLKYANLWLDKEQAQWWVSVMARNFMLPYAIKTVTMTVEDEDESLS